LPKDLEPSDLEAPYIRLLFGSIESIYGKWVNDYYVEALREALKIVTILPTDIKEALQDKKKAIKKDLSQAYRTGGSDFFLTHLRRNRTARKVAIIHFEPFFDEIIRRIDEKDWLEKGAFSARVKDKRRLDV